MSDQESKPQDPAVQTGDVEGDVNVNAPVDPLAPPPAVPAEQTPNPPGKNE